MRTLLFGGAAAVVMMLAFWAYQQNYRTQAALRETQAIQGEIARLRDRLTVLKAEWAYLNRPDRLRDLADLNFARLRLFPLDAERFGRLDQVPFPAPEPRPELLTQLDPGAAE